MFVLQIIYIDYVIRGFNSFVNNSGPTLVSTSRVKAETLNAFAKVLRSREAALTEFDEGLWGTLVDFVTVYGKGDIGITFRDGTEIRIQ